MTTRVDITELEESAGNIRGVAKGFAMVKGREQRIALATLHVVGQSEISVDLPKRMSPTDLVTVARGFLEFLEKLQPHISEPAAGTLDAEAVIAAEQAVIAHAQSRIAAFDAPNFVPLTLADRGAIFTSAEDFEQSMEKGNIRDGAGVWCTSKQKSDLGVDSNRLDWATHVLWHSR